MSYTRWLFTLNNYSDGDVANYGGPDAVSSHSLQTVFGGGFCGTLRRFVIGRETAPTSGTKHLQGYMEFTKRQSLSSCKRIFYKAHWEVARGSAKENYRYCTKDGEFTTLGDWSNLESKARNSSKVGLSNTTIVRTILLSSGLSLIHSDKYIRSKRSFDDMALQYASALEQTRRYSFYSVQKLSYWQMYICRRVFLQDNRKVLWVTDLSGGLGKTFLGHFLNSCYRYELFDGITKASDIAHLLPAQPRGIIFDVTRSDNQHFSYQTLEMCKNGFVMSGKYMGIKRIFTPCPVIVFANFEPDRSKLSDDRWDIHILQNGLPKERVFEAQTEYPFVPPEEVPSLEDEDKENSPPKKKKKHEQEDPPIQDI